MNRTKIGTHNHKVKTKNRLNKRNIKKIIRKRNRQKASINQTSL